MKKLPYILIVILSVVLFASVRSCVSYKSTANQNYDALTNTVKHYTNSLGTQTAAIETLQLSNSQLNDVVISKDKELAVLAKEFAKVKAVVKYRSQIIIDSIPVYYKDTIPIVFSRSGELKDKWYSFTYKSNQKGITIDSLRLDSETTVITGFKRKWFLGNETLVTNVTNSNPHIDITELKAAEVNIPMPWYKKWYVWLATGFAGGLILSK